MLINKEISLSLIIFTIGLFLTTFLSNQSDFNTIISGYVLMFGVYFYLVFYKKNINNNIKTLLIFSILLRCLLIFMLPPHSDDYFRFIWDGLQSLDGVHPYQYQPQDWIKITEDNHYQLLYEQLNSKVYFSVYPPILQSIFIIAASLFSSSFLTPTVIMKLFMVAAEIGTLFFIIKILKKYQISTKNVFIYALNPLVLVEISGNLHFEGLMIFFLIAAIYYMDIWKTPFQYNNWKMYRSPILFSMAIATKLIPLIFLPFILRYLGIIKSFFYFLIIGIVLIFVLILPFGEWQHFLNFKESLRLYYQHFEYNGGIYYIFRYLGFQYRGYNEIAFIGPALSIITFLSILSISFFRKYKSKEFSIEFFMSSMLMIWAIYQMMTTTLHPWYITPLILFSVFSHYRFGLLWSFLICFTYINYSYHPYHENLWVVFLEFSIVIICWIYEIFYKNSIKKKILTE